MTYAGFLVRFLIVPSCLLVGLLLWDARHGKTPRGFQNGKRFGFALGILGLLALVYTTPWDNYLVANQVWKYNPGLVNGLVLGWVPVEEYAFFILETLLAGLWWRWVVRRISPSADFRPSTAIRGASIAGAGLLWLGSVALFVFGWIPGTYLTLILVWSLPVLAVQCAFGADILWHQRRLMAVTVVPLVLYLSAVDTLAIQSGTWGINPATSTGLFIGKLPIEEALFFLMTVLMVACGLTLALSPVSDLRWSERLHRWVGSGRYRKAPSHRSNDLRSRSNNK